MNAFVTQAYEHRTFFTRLQQFVLMSDAFVVVSGASDNDDLATHSGRPPSKYPLILVGKMYAELVARCLRHMLRPELQLAHPEDIALPIC